MMIGEKLSATKGQLMLRDNSKNTLLKQSISPVAAIFGAVAQTAA